MSRSNWRSNAPLGFGIATVVVLLIIAGLINDQKHAQRSDGRAQKHSENTLESVKEAPVSVVGRHEPPPPDPKPERKEWREEQDLKAQWEQAQWAKYATFAAVVGSVVAALGIWLVKQTLDATRAQSIFLREQFGEQATTEQVKDRAQLITEVWMLAHPSEPIISFKIRNVGPTYAHVLRTTYEYAVTEGLPEEDEFSDKRPLPGRPSLIPAGQEALVVVSCLPPADSNQIEQLEREAAHRYLRVTIWYQDVFRQVYKLTTTGCYRRIEQSDGRKDWGFAFPERDIPRNRWGEKSAYIFWDARRLNYFEWDRKNNHRQHPKGHEPQM